MGKIFAVLVLILLAGGGWYYYQNMAGTDSSVRDQFGNIILGDSQATPTDTSTTMMEEGGMTEGEHMMGDGSMMETDPEAKAFNITGKSFAFSQTEIRVKEGDTVTVNFESTGGLHDWAVDEFESARTQQVEPGTKTSVTFVADKKGTFEYYCSVGQHRKAGMVGKLIVE